jgi:hypothetical protein
LRADNFWIDVGLGLGRVEVQENSRRSEYFSLDTSEFHNYRVLGNPEAGSYSFFIDEIELISSRSIGHTSVNINFLSFGDHISAFNGFPMGARADLASFTFAPIPEPTIIWLFLSGLGLLIAQYANQPLKN